MATLDELLHPITPAEFFADYEGRKPLHIPAAGGRGGKSEILTWSAFNGLLDRTGIWTSANLRLMRDHIAVPADQFCQPVETPNGMVMRPSPAKVEVFLSAGSSLVANDVLDLHPPLAVVGRAIGEAFAARIGANVYCSFQGIRAFGTHFDNHDVLVVQTEGEKVWNLYEARADNPLEIPADTLETRREFERTRGALMQEVVMRPGDVLYLPRGWYHDALAADGGSLHVTFSITPLTGNDILSLVRTAAMRDPAFRAWLPPAARDGGAALRSRLKETALMLASLAEAPDLFEAVSMAQAQLVSRLAGFTLPDRKPITLYRTTGRAFPPTESSLRRIYDWAIEEQRFALEDMIAQFEVIPESDVREGVEAAVRAGALQKV